MVIDDANHVGKAYASFLLTSMKSSDCGLTDIKNYQHVVRLTKTRFLVNLETARANDPKIEYRAVCLSELPKRSDEEHSEMTQLKLREGYK